MRTKNSIYVNLIYTLSATLLSTSAAKESPPTIITESTASEILFAVSEKDGEPGDPVTIECNATGHPAPGYRWEKNGEFFHWHRDYPRIFQSPASDGTLYITNPKYTDEGRYQCFAENHLGIATSNPVFVRRSYLNSSASLTPITVRAIEGQPITLACPSVIGYPQPDVAWLYEVNGTLAEITNTSRITFARRDGDLYFSNVTSDDCAATYWCCAQWTFRTKFVFGDRFVLEFAKPNDTSQREHVPTLLYPTETKQIGFIRKDIELCCIFGGTPLPQVEWYKNVKWIYLSERTQLRNFGKCVLIKSLAFDDPGNFTCVASNGVGGKDVSFSISLEVMESPFFTIEPAPVEAKIGEMAVISCSAFGNPSPRLRWIYNGESVTNYTGSRRMYGPEWQVIYDLRKSDTGKYGCNASNDYGYVYKEVSVYVADLEAEEPWITTEKHKPGETVLLFCSESDSKNPPPHFIRRDRNWTNPFAWRKNGKPIQNSEQLGSRVYASSFNGILFISNSQISDSAIYTCFYNYTDDDDDDDGDDDSKNSTSTMRSNITLIVQDVIRKPYVKLSVDCDSEDATTVWNRGPDYSSILCSTLQRSDDDDELKPNTWFNISNCMPFQSSLRILPLYPWTNSSYRVLVTCIDGWSELSNVYWCVGESDIPYKNPELFPPNEIVEPAPGELVITWTRLRKKDRNGPGFYYEVLWRKNPNNSWNVAKIPDWRTNVFRIANEPPYEAYTVKIIAANERGRSNDTVRERIVYSGEDVPTAAPSNVTLKELLTGNMSARVSWWPVQPDTVKGLFGGYRISVKSEYSDVEREVKVNSDVTEAVIPLRTDEENEISVSVFNRRYSGPLSDVLIINNCGPPKSVQNFRADTKTISGIRLSWIPAERLCGPIDLYTIRYRAISADKLNSSVTLTIPSDRTSTEILGLQPATTYRIGISTVNKAGNGDPYWIECNTTAAAEIKFTRPSISWYHVSSDTHNVHPSIRIGWTADRKQLEGGFYVKYKIRGGSKFDQTPVVRSWSAKIDGLNTGHTYEFVVVSVRGKVETESEVKYVDIRTGIKYLF